MHTDIISLVDPDKHKKKQVNNIAMITFWSQFSVYVLNTVLVLFLTRPVWERGLGYTESKAYIFIGVSQAMGYIMPMIGGQMADKVIGLRRSILIGSFLVACAYLMIMLSGLLVPEMGDKVFIAAYALIPATNSLLLGTASAVVSKVYASDEAKAKAGMTLYYMSINVGALLATILAPQLIESRYGPLSIFAVVFLGKSISALNYSYRYQLYSDVATQLDNAKFSRKRFIQVFAYLITVYLATLYIYRNPEISSYIIGIGAMIGMFAFFLKTLNLRGSERVKQFIAAVLILEAIVFFVIYNQMNTTLILFAKNNSNLAFLGFKVSPAHYQMLNPLLIIGLSFVMPKFYQQFKSFTIPYQFAAGTALSGLSLLVMYLSCLLSVDGLVNGNFLVLTYVLLTIAELWVSAIGLSMIGLYCSHHMIAFAMGIWYLSTSLSNVISGHLAQFVALPESGISVTESLLVYQHYYLDMGLVGLSIGIIMYFLAFYIHKHMSRKGISLA